MRRMQRAWLAARPAYLQSEVFRFYGKPIDAEKGGAEPFLNAWPMDMSEPCPEVPPAQGGEAGAVLPWVELPSGVRSGWIGTNLSPNGATSHSPGLAPAPPWVRGKMSSCPVGAASQKALKLAPFGSGCF
jgi:hypothetical protein